MALIEEIIEKAVSKEVLEDILDTAPYIMQNTKFGWDDGRNINNFNSLYINYENTGIRWYKTDHQIYVTKIEREEVYKELMKVDITTLDASEGNYWTKTAEAVEVVFKKNLRFIDCTSYDLTCLDSEVDDEQINKILKYLTSKDEVSRNIGWAIVKDKWRKVSWDRKTD